VDLQNRIVLPGFIDGHVHILNFGMSLQKLDLLSRCGFYLKNDFVIVPADMPDMVILNYQRRDKGTP
jgi:hypothetical protein